MSIKRSQKPNLLVVKVGSSGVALAEGGVDPHKLSELVKDIHYLMQQGIKVVLVSSGAIQVGRKYLPIDTDKRMNRLQALSALGQPMLMESYILGFRALNLQCAQVLLTHEDFSDKRRYLNARNTIMTLLDHGIVPIINENDVVSFHEITVGDNDQLAAMSAHMIGADQLLILTGPDGLYDRNPELPGAVAIREVPYGQSPLKLSVKGKSKAGRGGMATKLDAIKRSTMVGVPVTLATYNRNKPLSTPIEQDVGTCFLPNPNYHTMVKQSVLVSTVKAGAVIKLDEGAMKAMMKGASLLPSGIVGVNGSFRRGDCVSLKHGRSIFASGLVEYHASEVKKIMGRQASDVEAILGHCPSKVVIHRNNLILKEPV